MCQLVANRPDAIGSLPLSAQDVKQVDPGRFGAGDRHDEPRSVTVVHNEQRPTHRLSTVDMIVRSLPNALPPSAITIRIRAFSLDDQPVLPVTRHGRRLGQMAALGGIDGDTEQKRAAGQEERCPVHPEAMAGVA